MDLGSTSYGEGQETAMLNTAAPKSKTRGIADDVGGRPSNPLQAVTPIFADSQNKAQDIMTGAPMGPGAGPEGPEALMMRKTSVKTSDTLAPLLPFDTTGEIGILYQDALSRGD
jgi:hypothetical protein